MPPSARAGQVKKKPTSAVFGKPVNITVLDLPATYLSSVREVTTISVFGSVFDYSGLRRRLSNCFGLLAAAVFGLPAIAGRFSIKIIDLIKVL